MRPSRTLRSSILAILIFTSVQFSWPFAQATPESTRTLKKPELSINLSEDWIETDIKEARKAIQANLLGAELYAYELELDSSDDSDDQESDLDPAYLVLLRSNAGKFTAEELKQPRNLYLDGKFKNFNHDLDRQCLDFDFFARYERKFAQRGLGTFALTKDGAIILLLKAPADRFPELQDQFLKIRQSLTVSPDLAYPQEKPESNLPVYFFWLCLAVILAFVKMKLSGDQE